MSETKKTVRIAIDRDLTEGFGHVSVSLPLTEPRKLPQIGPDGKMYRNSNPDFTEVGRLVYNAVVEASGVQQVTSVLRLRLSFQIETALNTFEDVSNILLVRAAQALVLFHRENDQLKRG